MKTISTLDEAMKTQGTSLDNQQRDGESIIRGEDKMVFIPALAKREAAAESPRFDFAQDYFAIERRQADALENCVFILLWLSSLFALACCLSVQPSG